MKKEFVYSFIVVFNLLNISISFAHHKPKEITNYVSGRVIDERNFPVPFAKVIIRNAEAETDKFGKFRIQDVTFPYDVAIAEGSSSTAVIYKNLNAGNPELTFFGKLEDRNANTATIKVEFPEIPAGSSATIKFISQDVFYSNDVDVLPGEKTKSILIYWPYTARNLKGSVLFLQKNVSSYELFYNKQIIISKSNFPVELNLSGSSKGNIKTSDLNVNLGSKKFKSSGYSVFADFINYDVNSAFEFEKKEGKESHYKCIIPLKLPVSYRLKVSGYLENNDGSGFINYSIAKPGTTLNLPDESPPDLQTPTNNYMGATGNTEFYYSLGSGTGIFVVQFHSDSPELNFYIVTSERTAYLNYLSREEFRKTSSVKFTWSVKKYLTYFSVDDFVRPNQLNNNAGYRAELFSAERTFKTGYF